MTFQITLAKGGNYAPLVSLASPRTLLALYSIAELSLQLERKQILVKRQDEILTYLAQNRSKLEKRHFET